MYVNWDYNKRVVDDHMKIENALWNNDGLVGCLWVDTFKKYIDWNDGEEIKFHIDNKCIWGKFGIYITEDNDTNGEFYNMKIDSDGYLNIFNRDIMNYELLNCVYNDEMNIVKGNYVFK
jgi:hypothetical protein